MKAALYARVSSKEQLEGYSIDAQRRAFKLLCEGRKWEPVGEYVDEGRSARTDNLNKRPAFQKLLAEAHSRLFDVVVVHKLDRFSRNRSITFDSLDKLAKDGVGFISMTEQMDFSTPSGQLALTLFAGLAQFYSDNLSQETKKGKRERKAQGLYNGALPFGVMKGSDGLPKPHNEDWIIRDKKGNVTDTRKPVHDGLLLIFQLAARGETDKTIAQVLNTKGYRTTGTHGRNPFSKDTIGGILENRFYIGELPDEKSGWVKGKHAAIISVELFEAAQDARALRRALPQTIRSDAHVYSLSGIAKCGVCGSRLRVVTPTRMLCKHRLDIGGCTQPSAVLPIVEDQVGAYLRAFKLPENYKEQMLAARRDTGDVEKEAQIAAIKARLNRIKELYSWGDMNKAEYLMERQSLQAQLAKLTAQDTRRS